MGNASRKLTPCTAPQSTLVSEDATPYDPDYLDPRSPTPDVTRTPISNTEAQKHKITKNIDLNKTLETTNFEEKLVYNSPILSAVIRNHLQSFDPRSPTQEFERTPIVISNQNKKLLRDNNGVKIDYGKADGAPLQEARPQGLTHELFDSVDSTFEDSEPLGSSTASQDAIENVASPVTNEGLLETNFDFVSEESILKSDTLMKNHALPVLSAFQKLKVSDKDPRSPSQGIERTPIFLPQRVVVIPKNEPVEEMSEELLVAALQNNITDFSRTPVIPADGGLLIYEDDCAKDVTPRKTKSVSTGTRTPLSCMKNKTEGRPKSTADISVKKKVGSKIPKRVSAIRKTLSKECDVEHENTPPACHAQVWDKDSSVVL